MDTSTQDIKNKIDIVEYIGQFVPLKKAGRNFKGNCPFHNEKTPSFVVSPERQIWRCFGACQDGGDVISFLMKWENITFFEALRDLAQIAGVTLEHINFEDQQWKIKESLIKVNTLTAKYYHYLLTKHPTGKKALEYVKKRNISDKIITSFQLGYSPSNWDSLTTYLNKKGFQNNLLEQAGISLKGRNGSYDRFRGRLIFPIIDSRNTIIGFSGRIIEQNKDDKISEAKYINSPETPLYRKRETLYGINMARDDMRKQNKAIIVEGEFDMLSCFMHGITNTVAIKGSAFTREQLQLLKRYTQHIILALDADFSGTETTKRALKEAEELDFRVHVASFDNAKDPDEALQKDPVAFKKSIKNSISVYDYIINESIKRHEEKSAYDKKEIADDVVPFIEGITNPIVQNYYTKRLSALLEVDEAVIDQLMYTFKKKKKIQTRLPIQQRETKNRFELLQKYILTILFQQENNKKTTTAIISHLKPEYFSIESYKNLFERFVQYRENHKKALDIQTFASSLPPELQSVFDELFLFDLSALSDVDPTKNTVRVVLDMKRTSLKKRLKEMAQSDNSKQLSELTQELSQVEKEMINL